MPENLNFNEAREVISESKNKEKQVLNYIAEYQRDRSNKAARSKAMEGIKERTLVLSSAEYEKYIDEKYNFLPKRERDLRKEMFGFSHTPDTRAVLNKDALNETSLPYILTHEETEILEEGPFPRESKKWQEEHGDAKHPQENIVSHVEATYEEYRHAKRDGNLDAHHNYIVDEIKRLMSDNSLKDLVKTEEEQRSRIYNEVKNEK